MRLLLLGDCHFRSSAPARRTDDFFQTQLDKMEQVKKIYVEQRCDAVLQAGDLFDSPKQPMNVLYCLKELLQGSWAGQFYTVPGQHDLYMRDLTSLKRTAVGVLSVGKPGSVNVVGMNGIPGPVYIKEDVCLYGKPYGAKPIKKMETDGFHILLAHVSVGPDKLWEGHDLISPAEYAEAHPFDLIVLGDYHYPFEERIGNTVVINPGCLVRLTAGERDIAAHPQVVVFDTETKESENIPLDIKPAKEVFSELVTASKEEQVSASVLSMIEKLKKGIGEGQDFRTALSLLCKETGIHESVVSEIDSAIEEAIHE